MEDAVVLGGSYSMGENQDLVRGDCIVERLEAGLENS